jgi:hypothetical protein
MIAEMSSTSSLQHTHSIAFSVENNVAGTTPAPDVKSNPFPWSSNKVLQPCDGSLLGITVFPISTFSQLRGQVEIVIYIQQLSFNLVESEDRPLLC